MIPSNFTRCFQSCLLTGLLVVQLPAWAQETFPVNGVKDKAPKLYAFTNATLHTDSRTTLTNATLLIRDGRVEAAGTKVAIPAGAVVTDLKGSHIYPSFIDPYTSYGISSPKPAPLPAGSPPQFISSKKGAYHWNPAVAPETDAAQLFGIDKAAAKDLRSIGFGTVLSFNPDGIVRGSGMAVTLNEDRDNEVVLRSRASAHYSFSKGSSQINYPASLMGSIALLRQTYLDAKWYASQQNPKEVNLSLEAFNNLQTLPQIIEVRDKYAALKADAIGDEAGVQFILKVVGEEYQRLEEMKKTKAALIVPLNFPAALEVEDPYDALMVPLTQLKHWEMAPTNAAALAKAGIVFAFTTADLKEKKDFLKNLRLAVELGLPKEKALEALTQAPAQLLKLEQQVGTLNAGKLANFIIASGDIFEKETVLQENWVRGNRFVVQPRLEQDLRGTYALQVDQLAPHTFILKGKAANPEPQVMRDTLKLATTFLVKEGLATLLFLPSGKEKNQYVRLSGHLKGDSLMGRGQLTDGTWVNWRAWRTGAAPADTAAKKKEPAQMPQATVSYPFGAYGLPQRQQAEPVLVRNATVWTNEQEGVLQEADVLLSNGKIVAVGKNLNVQKLLPRHKGQVQQIDGTGHHLTSGIIDEHSHIAIAGGVNEGTQAVTAEVRIGDVINPEDVNIYRQLAGGVTAIQQLHGSANPIGGQSSLVKLRWGASAEEMKIAGADGFIKFALGENVKQSNWGQQNAIRFPQSRMGVEQVFYDAFIRAREYEQSWKQYNSLSAGKRKQAIAPRRDLELETVLEIANGQRFISCHSYVQSEVNMLMKVADSMHFRVNTFTHILEGYKLADKMKAHGAAASTFSDWWAYKMEVNDAIPYNGALLHSQQVLTGFNSDDAEMGRRLNQEAAKGVKYGGMSEEEAWKLVTLNPAKMLHLDKQMGSIKAGKDADVVLWSGHPLSIYSQPLKTFVDGILLYDLQRHQELQQRDLAERARLIGKMIAHKKAGGATEKPEAPKTHTYHCDDLESYEEY